MASHNLQTHFITTVGLYSPQKLSKANVFFRARDQKMPRVYKQQCRRGYACTALTFSFACENPVYCTTYTMPGQLIELTSVITDPDM